MNPILGSIFKLADKDEVQKVGILMAKIFLRRESVMQYLNTSITNGAKKMHHI